MSMWLLVLASGDITVQWRLIMLIGNSGQKFIDTIIWTDFDSQGDDNKIKSYCWTVSNPIASLVLPCFDMPNTRILPPMLLHGS